MQMDEASSETSQQDAGAVLITGANRGIGLEFVRSWLERGSTVFACCRVPTTASALSSLQDQYQNRLQVVALDLMDEHSVDSMAEAIGNTKIDLLINNAGILEVETLDKLNFSSVLQQFRVNALGALMVTRALLSNLREGAKIVNVSSRMGSLDDNTSGGYYGYRMSKAALNMATRSLAVDMKKRGVIVIAIHPGMVQTDLTRGYGMMTAAESVAEMNCVIDRLTPEQTGQFVQYQGTNVPW